MKRDTASTIFRTVVFAGAMLGAPACTKKPATTTPPTNTATEPAKTGDPAMMQGDGMAKKPAADGDHGGDPCGGDPCGGDPCGGERPRGGDDEGGGMGRGFILS